MDLNKDYHENLRIGGKPAALSFVTNEIDAATGETVITRVYMTSDGVKHPAVERIPAKAKPATSVPTPAEKAEEPPAPKTFPRPVSTRTKLGALKTKDLTSGQTVVYPTKEGREAGVIAKVMFRTVCIDIDGTKDKQVRKSDVLGLYLED